MDNSEVFIEKYKELEEAVRNRYRLSPGDSISYYLSHLDEYRSYQDEIRYCQEVRNLLQHKRKINASYPVEPADATIEFITSLIDRIKDRKKCREICIPFQKICYRSLNDHVKEAMLVMKQNNFSCIPIVENRKVIGAFDENSLFEYLSKEELPEIDDELCFSDISSFLSLTQREMEDFMFFTQNGYVEDIYCKFEQSFTNGKRLAAVFLTMSGSQNEDLYGMLTAWDVLNFTFR